jgi:hypothetical protein
MMLTLKARHFGVELRLIFDWDGAWLNFRRTSAPRMSDKASGIAAHEFEMHLGFLIRWACLVLPGVLQYGRKCAAAFRFNQGAVRGIAQ